MKYLWIILLGVLIFFVFKGVRIFVRRISSEKKYFKNIWTLFSLIEFVSWSAFIFLSVHHLYQHKSYYNYLFIGLITIFVLLISYYFLNDLFAGAIFRIQHHPQIGKYYDFKKFSGKVKQIGSTGIVLETADGEEVDVPYSQLKGPVFESKEVKAQSDVKVKLVVEKKMPKEDLMQKIREIVLNSAYTSFKKGPVIRIISEDDSQIHLEIIINTFNTMHQAILERKLKEEL